MLCQPLLELINLEPYLEDVREASEIRAYDEKVRFYVELKESIGHGSGDFLDYKAYEPDMRKLIDNYIVASDSVKIGEFDDFTLLDFVESKGEDLTDGKKSDKAKAGAAEAIENNIRRKIVEKVTVNPKYYAKMSAILDKLIEERKKGVEEYKKLLEQYVNLAKDVEKPEENEAYPESIRGSRAMQAIYDNIGEDEELAIKIHNAVMMSRIAGFRGDEIKERKIKRELNRILNDASEVERLYKIIEKQEEY